VLVRPAVDCQAGKLKPVDRVQPCTPAAQAARPSGRQSLHKIAADFLNWIAAMSIFRYFVAVLAFVAGPAFAAELLIPAAPDFATQTLNNPWDMADDTDVYPLLWTHNLAAATAANGVMTGTPRDTDAHFWAHFPQIARTTTTLDNPFIPIDATRYTRLAFYMWLPETVAVGSTNGRILWHLGGESVAQFDANYSEAPIFPVYPGWHLYTFDLKAVKQTDLLAGQRWAGPWAGAVSGLRIDPSLGAALPFKIGWIRLVDSADKTASLAGAQFNTPALAVRSDVYTPGAVVATLARQSDGSFDFANLPPGSYQVAPLSDEDYTLAVRGAAWSMASISDFNWASRHDWKSEGILGGKFQGATAGPDPFLLMDIPLDKPVDASKYRYLRIKMELSGVPASESGLLVWWGNRPVDFTAGNSGFIPVQAGEKEYLIDLGSKAGWSGLIKALRIDPLNGPNAGSSVTVKISSVRLSRTATSALEPVTFLADTVRVNLPPQAKILAPSFSSGNDYARTVLGRPWDMKDGFSTPGYSNLLNADFVKSIPELGLTGDFFRGVSQPVAVGATEGDPSVFFLFQENRKPIDANSYRLLRVRMYVPFNVADQNELTVGAVVRMNWKETDFNSFTTYDMPLLPGLRDIWVDMSQVRVEGNTGLWANTVRYLRVDPFEFSPSRQFYLGGASLHTLPTVSTVMPLALSITARPGASMIVRVYVDDQEIESYKTTSSGLQGFDVGMSSVAAGQHKLKVCVEDGSNQNCSSLAVPFIRTSDAASAGTSDADSVFAWVEALAPHILKPNGESSQIVQGFYARCYATSGQCIAAKDNRTYYFNGSSLADLGSLSGFIAQAKSAGF
jgi:hypothetical protein